VASVGLARQAAMAASSRARLGRNVRPQRLEECDARPMVSSRSGREYRPRARRRRLRRGQKAASQVIGEIFERTRGASRRSRAISARPRSTMVCISSPKTRYSECAGFSARSLIPKIGPLVIRYLAILAERFKQPQPANNPHQGLDKTA
jgi:hypothetical protein